LIPKITTREDMAKSGLVFGMGRFQYQSQPLVISDFGVYNDGLAAVAEKTEWAEAFLEDVAAWVRSEFGFRELSSGLRKLYNSSVVVDFEASPSRLVANFKRIADLISDRSVTITGDRRQMDFGRLDFEVDRGLGGLSVIPKFTIERRIGTGVSFAQERYFSNAPMRTADHIATLEEIERMAANA
jgi:hypothetical protein